jgi:septal ring factor EnvC (AmiA/AmiB activator)
VKLVSDSYVIGLIVAAAVGALGFFMKLQFNDIRNGILKNGEDLKEVTDKIDKRMDELEKKTQADISKVQDELKQLKADLPFVYTTREDFIRTLNNVDNQMSGIGNKIDKLLQK